MKERISYVNRSATVAWSPVQDGGLLAAGTVANAISDSFDASGVCRHETRAHWLKRRETCAAKLLSTRAAGSLCVSVWPLSD